MAKKQMVAQKLENMVRLSKILKFIQKNLNSSWHIERVNIVKKANGIILILLPLDLQ